MDGSWRGPSAWRQGLALSARLNGANLNVEYWFSCRAILDDAPASFMGDGAYDRAHVFNAVRVRTPDVRFIVPPCKGAVLGPTATTAPTQRDSHIRSINKHGRMNWQKTSGYNRRSKIEAAIGCYKRVIGDALRSREDARRLCEGENRSQGA